MQIIFKINIKHHRVIGHHLRTKKKYTRIIWIIHICICCYRSSNNISTSIEYLQFHIIIWTRITNSQKVQQNLTLKLVCFSFSLLKLFSIHHHIFSKTTDKLWPLCMRCMYIYYAIMFNRYMYYLNYFFIYLAVLADCRNKTIWRWNKTVKTTRNLTFNAQNEK